MKILIQSQQRFCPIQTLSLKLNPYTWLRPFPHHLLLLRPAIKRFLIHHSSSSFLRLCNLISLWKNMSSDFLQCLWVIREFVVEILPVTPVEFPWSEWHNILFLSSVLVVGAFLAEVVLISPVSFILGFRMFLVDDLFGVVVEIEDIVPLVYSSWNVDFRLVWLKPMDFWKIFVEVFSCSEVFR